MQKIKFFIVTFLTIAFTSSASAKEGGVFSLGVGVVGSTQIYRDMDAKVIPIPFVHYSGDKFYFRGLQMGYKIYDAKSFEVTLFAEGRMDGYDADDSAYFRGMDDRKKSIDGGLRLSKAIQNFKTTIDFKHDLLGVYDGFESSLKLSYIHGGRFGMITPSIGVSYMSENLTDYYYGVQKSEATTQRSAYTSEGSFSPFLGVMMVYRFTPNLSAMANLKASYFADEITNSPLVERDIKYGGVVGISYRF